jgi:YVTN family beta-propeller protein
LLTRTFAAGLAAAVTLIGFASLAPAHDEFSKLLFVPNRASADVAVIDTESDKLLKRIAVGKVPHQVAVSAPLGKITASNTADNTITLVDMASGDSRSLTLAAEPEHMELNAAGDLLAVGNIAAGSVSFIALDAGLEVARVEGLFEPHNLTFSADGGSLYVSNLGADHVTVIDTETFGITKEIPVAEPTLLASTTDESLAEYQGIINVTATIDGRLGFAAHGESNQMAVIDLDAGKRLTSIPLGELPWRAYATADGRHMLVPNNGDKTVSVIDTESLAVVATLPGAEDMTGVNGNDAGDTAYVISRGESKLVVLDLVTMTKKGEIALPGVPETGVVAPGQEKLYVALSSSDQVAVVDLLKGELTGTIDDVGDEPWGASMAGARNYCH